MKIIKDIRKNTIVLLLITSIVLFFVLKDHFSSIIDTIKNMNFFYLFLAILMYFLYIILKAYIVYLTVNNKKKVTFKEAIKHNIITQFFNGITPFSTGGQPMEIYMLTEHNIGVGEATSITLQNFIYYQTALVIYGIIVVIYNCIFHIFPKIPILRRLVILGFIINVIVVIILLAITIYTKFTKKLVIKILNWFNKKGIIKDKNKDKIEKKLLEKIKEFEDSSKIIRKRKDLYVKGILINLLSLTALYIVPLFIVYGFKDYSSLTTFNTLTASAYTLLVGSFVPIPGASGGIEYSFLKFFGSFLKTVPLNSLLIVWRFITYYLAMILGAVIFSIEKKGD